MSTGKQINWCRWGYLAAALVAGALLAGAPVSAQAAVPGSMIIDGVLTSSGGGAAADGTYNVTFGLYAAETGGSAVWTEGPVKIVVKNGGFDYALGTAKPIDPALLANLSPPWLAITVETEPTLPRVPLHAVAYALRAAAADALDCSGCLLPKHIGKGAVTTAAIADAAVGDAQLAVNYAASDSKGGAAKGLTCTGCIGGGHIDTKTALTVAGLTADTAVLGGLAVTGAATVGGQAICTEAGNCKDTMQKLACQANELMVWNGSAWACAQPPKSGVTLDQLGCKAGEVVTYDGANWGCKALSNQLGALQCKQNEVPVKQADGKWGCGTLAAASTPGDPCGGAYEVLQWDGKIWKCVNVLATGLSKGNYNGFEIVDSWGDAWDGMERGNMNWTNAKNLCESLGARLPTGTELWRVSNVKTGAVGGSQNTNYLWAGNPYAVSPFQVIVTRLSDGSMSTSDYSSSRPFRCIWPAPRPANFSANNCYGPAGNACFKLKTEGKRFVLDAYDRAPMSHGAALWECNQAYGSLAQPVALMEAIQSQAPNGTNNWLWVNDMVRYEIGSVFRWNNVDPSWTPSSGNTTSWAGLQGFYSFRCAGVAYDAGTHPVELPNKAEFVAKNHLKFDNKDRSAANWITAVDTCYAAGGHLPRAGELGQAIAEGMPNGTNNWLWTADQIEYNSAQPTVAILKWSTTTQPFFGFYYSEFLTNSYKSDSRPFRCAYYPIDKDYAGPDNDNDCAGGCQAFALPGNSGAKVWTDKFDRVGTTLGSAANVCLSKGGHLWSERDASELIRKGLVNGTNNWLHTWDLMIAYSGYNVHYNKIVRWSGTGTTGWIDDYGSSQNTWSDFTSTRPYRCIWTNELRH